MIKDQKKENKNGETFENRKINRIKQNQSLDQSKSRVRGDGIQWRDAHSEFIEGEACLISENEVNTLVTWEEVSWDFIRESSARQILEQDNTKLDDQIIGKQYI